MPFQAKAQIFLSFALEFSCSFVGKTPRTTVASTFAGQMNAPKHKTLSERIRSMPIWLLLLLGFLGIAASEYATKKLEVWLVKYELVEDPEKSGELAEKGSQILDKSAAE